MKYSIIVPILILGLIIILCGLWIHATLFIIIGSLCIVGGLSYLYVSNPSPPTILSLIFTNKEDSSTQGSGSIGYLTLTCTPVWLATSYQAIAFCPLTNYSGTSTSTTITIPVSEYGYCNVYVQAITPFGTSYYSSDSSANRITFVQVPCTVSEWSAWGNCSTTGIQTRTRTIVSPEKNGGSCPILVETQPCPVDCVVSEWSAWSTCSAQCSVTIAGQTRTPSQYRSRSITVEPLNGGALCPAEQQQTQFCNQVDCATYCNKYSTCPAIASQIINVCLETQGNFGGNYGPPPSC